VTSPRTPQTRWLGGSLERQDVVGSTMEACAAAARAGAPDGHVVIARRQTAGRGRTGCAWHSADDGGLYLSLLLRGFVSPGAARGLTLAAGLGVGEAVRRLGVPTVTLKWPNDVLVGGRKVAGILAEWSGEDAVIVGVGLNVSQPGFPAELSGIATSVALASGRNVDTEAALEVLLDALAEAFDAFRREGLPWAVREWTARTGLWGRRARAAGVDGTLLRLEPDGSLIVRCDDGRERTITADAVDLL